MNRIFVNIILQVTLLCAIGICQATAQSLDQAKKLYNEGQYAEAKPVIEKLVKQIPSNTSYNLWYGVCCYETGDYSEAEVYLEKAAKRRSADAYRYLSKLYFRSYRFQEALDTYALYQEQLSKKKQTPEEGDTFTALAKNAQRMMDKVEDVQVIDSVVTNADNFLSAYTLSEECGSLYSAQQFFKSSKDTTTVYMNQKGDKIYYASPTDDKHYCLFNQSKLMDKWEEEKRLPMTVNTDQDDNYPFVMSDGVTIYFASKGYSSIGGYDLFVTRYNIESDSYLTPEQLGMPFNSLYNDYMIVFDETKNLGWFVSDRFQPKGKVCVYLFIPNTGNKRIESDDEAMKRSHAALFSIKDTWKENDYSKLISLSHQEIPFGKKKVQHDFEFIINDSKTCYTLNDIRSTEARNIYMKVLAEKKQIAGLEDKLETLRSRYSSNKSDEKTKQEILEYEKELSTLYGEPEQLEMQARNAEIRSLKK